MRAQNPIILWLSVLPLVFRFGGDVQAHPVPNGLHLKTIDVRPRPKELCIHFRLEVDQFTTVYIDSRDLFDEGEIRKFLTPRLFYEEFARRLGPILAKQLRVTLDGQPLALSCLEQRIELGDHLICDYLFTCDWNLRSGEAHTLEVYDSSYDLEPGRIKLTLSEDAAIQVLKRTIPSASLQARAVSELRPGDDRRLRSLAAKFELDSAPAKDTLPATQPEITQQAASEKVPGSELMALLDSPRSFGFLLVMALFFGAAHALTPGHGKTLVAAYLVGERGTIGHALLLGLTTTITHTGSVILLALGLLWWFPDAVPARIQTMLGFVGGLLIAGLGIWLFLQRISGRTDHLHIGGDHTHHPDGSVTVHERPVHWSQLIILGISGGIVPCWDAIAMLGFAIAAQRLWLGVPLLLAFSAGLAGVLIAIGIAVVSARGVMSRRWTDSRVWKLLPLGSAAVLIVIGLWLCRQSLGSSTLGS